MGTYAGDPTYGATIYTLETTDPVLGGANGVSNLPLKNLADRTAWLKQANDAAVGMVGFFATPTLPTGWLKANGARLYQATYAALFAKLGNRFGQYITGPGGGNTVFTSYDRMGNSMSHGLTTENEVRLEAFGDPITVLFGGGGSPITPSTPCYVRVLTASTFSLHPSEADATANLNAAQQATFQATAWATVELAGQFSLPDFRSQRLIGLDDGLGVYDQPIGGYSTFGAVGNEYSALPLLACIKYE